MAKTTKAEIKTAPAKETTAPVKETPAAEIKIAEAEVKAETVKAAPAKKAAKAAPAKKAPAAKKPAAEKKPAKKAAAKKAKEPTIGDIVAKAYNKIDKAAAAKVTESIAVQINVYGTVEDVFYISVIGGVVEVMPYPYFDRDIEVSVSFDDIMKIVDGKLTLKEAITTGTMDAKGDIKKSFILASLI